MFWDVRRGAKADKITLSSNAHQIVWNPRECEMFATGHDTEVKFWDRRKFADGCPVASFVSPGSAIKKMQFDPVYGKLFMAQDRDTVRLYKADDGQELDLYPHARHELVTSQFLPFRDAGAPGLILLPNRSSSFVYLQVEEGVGKSIKQQQMGYGSPLPFSSDGGQLSDKQGESFASGHNALNQSWNLRFLKKKTEAAGPKPQASSHDVSPDIDAFAVRRDSNGSASPSDDVFQVISVSSDHSIRIMTLH